MTEKWRPVVGYEDKYEVSNYGRVRSLRTGRLRALVKEASGHHSISLCRNGIKRHVNVHRLVLDAFVGPCPPGHEGCHKDGDPDNNHADNLYYGTRSQNLYDMVRHGKHWQANKTHCKYGHEFTPENTIWRRRGHRTCRECKNVWSRTRRAEIRLRAEALVEPDPDALETA